MVSFCCKTILMILLCLYGGKSGLAGTSLSPRESMQEFLLAVKAKDYDSARRFVDLGGVGHSRQIGALDKAFVVLERVFRLDLLSLSPDQEGRRNDGLAYNREVLFADSQSGQTAVYYLVLKEGSTKSPDRLWQIERNSLGAILSLEVGPGAFSLGEIVPDVLKAQFVGLHIWQWLGLFLSLLSAFGLASLLRVGMESVFQKLVLRFAVVQGFSLPRGLARPFQFIIAAALFSKITRYLEFGFTAREFISIFTQGVFLVCSVWLVLMVIDEVFTWWEKRLDLDGKSAVKAILPVTRTSTQILLVVMGGLFFLQNLGYDITALIAGLGIGGIAVALAGQKTIENLLGGFMVIMDQPIRVNDFGRYGDTLGTVETIGLRSTRIRTLDRTLITIPNADFAQMSIENYAERDNIRLYCVLGLRYDTSPDQLRYLLVEIKKLLVSHEKLENDPARVRFINFNAYSLDIEVFAFVKTCKWQEFLAVREDVYLDILQLVNDSGTGFAFPSQTIFWERGDGLDPDLSQKAEERVRQWRQDKQIPLPEVPQDVIESWSNSCPYPKAEAWVSREMMSQDKA